MFTERHLPQNLPPDKLDDYLAKGWYRSGQSIFTCNFLIKEGALYTVIWTRLPLENYASRKGQRKLLRKNRERFDIVIRPEQFTSEKEELYQIYREDFNGNLAPTLRSSLLDDGTSNIFDTWEICIYDAGKLVGFSIFDLGNKSIESIKAVYDPKYKSHSLGYYTMLEEIEFAKSKECEFYYPGYVVPGYVAFDYKLRAGIMEYFTPANKEWRPIEEFDEEQLLHKIMLKKLETLRDELELRGIPTRMGIYPLYETVFWNLETQYYLSFPLVLQIYPDFLNFRYLNFVYDPKEAQYRFIPCEGLQDTTEYFGHHLMPNPEIPIITELLGESDNLLASDKPKEAIYRMKMWMSRQMFI